jgi:hypothetical protein
MVPALKKLGRSGARSNRCESQYRVQALNVA